MNNDDPIRQAIHLDAVSCQQCEEFIVMIQEMLGFDNVIVISHPTADDARAALSVKGTKALLRIIIEKIAPEAAIAVEPLSKEVEAGVAPRRTQYEF